MRRALPVLVPLLGLSLAGCGAAESRYEDRARCLNANADISIAGCTALIQSGQETSANLARAFNRRGNAYRAKGQDERAIQDYDQAIRLDPNYAEPFSNRGGAGATADITQATRLKPDIAKNFERWGVRGF